MKKWLCSKAFLRWYHAEPGSRADAFWFRWMIRLRLRGPERVD